MKTAIDLDDYAKVYGTYADAISVLTEPEFFRGSFERLAAVRERTTRPLLAKDFIVSDRQLLAAYRCGADAVLLMLSVLAPDGYRDLAVKAKALGLEVLTEASSVEEARVALELGAKIIGINNRNLRTLEVDVNRAPNIASELTGDLPADVVLVAESGYTSFTAIAKAVAAAPRLNAFLCGSALSQASNLSLAVRELLFGHSKSAALRAQKMQWPLLRRGFNGWNHPRGTIKALCCPLGGEATGKSHPRQCSTLPTARSDLCSNRRRRTFSDSNYPANICP